MAGFDWPGLLKWSLAYTDGTGASTEAGRASPRSPEDLDFLKKALESLTGDEIDVKKLIQEAAAMLFDPQAKTHEVLSAVAAIDEGLDLEPELARNLDKYCGLLQGLQRQLGDSADSAVREKVAEVLALALPNNLRIQNECHRNGLLEVVMCELKKRATYAASNDEDEVRYFTKMMSVLNALVKHDDAAERDFLIRHDGRAFLQNCRTNSPRLQTKIDSMLQHVEYILKEKPQVVKPEEQMTLDCDQNGLAEEDLTAKQKPMAIGPC